MGNSPSREAVGWAIEKLEDAIIHLTEAMYDEEVIEHLEEIKDYIIENPED